MDRILFISILLFTTLSCATSYNFSKETAPVGNGWALYNNNCAFEVGFEYHKDTNTSVVGTSFKSDFLEGSYGVSKEKPKLTDIKNVSGFDFTKGE